MPHHEGAQPMTRDSTAPALTTPTRVTDPPCPPAQDLVAFFLLTFVLTWMFTIPAGLTARGTISLPVHHLVPFVLGGFGPMAAALLMVGRRSGRAGIRGLFAQLDPRGVPLRWYAVSGMLVPLNLVPVAGYLASGGVLPDSGTLLGVLLLFPVQFVLVAVIGGGLDEEMGWRGYALPTWLGLSHPLVANLLLGVVWSMWHLPLWLDPAGTHAAIPFALYLVTTVSRSLLMGWLYCASGRSLAVAIVAHALSNAADGVRYQLLGDARGDLTSYLVLMATYVAAAVVVIILTRGGLGADRPSLRQAASAPAATPSARPLPAKNS